MGNNNQEQSGFSYTYSAKEQAELKKIREKYTPSKVTEDKMARLRRLDAGVTQTALTFSLAIGILGVLILGFGMSLIMTDLAQILGNYRDMAMPIGIVIGIVGGLIAGLAYPIYQAIIKYKRRKIAPEILRLTDELIK